MTESHIRKSRLAYSAYEICIKVFRRVDLAGSSDKLDYAPLLPTVDVLAFSLDRELASELVPLTLTAT